MQGITSITYVPELSGGTPARSNIRTGHVWVSLKRWNIPKEHRIFILLHEQGHIIGQTHDEVKADEYAFNEYVKLGYSLTESIKALTRVLTFSNKEHYWRVYQQLLRADSYDCRINGNQKACEALKKHQTKESMENILDQKNHILDPSRKTSRQIGLERNTRLKDSLLGNNDIANFDWGGFMDGGLGSLAGLGSSVFNELSGANDRAAKTAAEIAQANADAQRQAAQNQAMLLAAQNQGKTATMMPFIIGAAVIAVAIVLFIVLRKK